MLEAAPPSDACSSHTEKSKTELGSQCGPGGEEEGGRRWKNTVRYQTRGRKGQKGKTVKPTNFQDGHCHSSASLLGKVTTRTWRVVPRGEGTTVWLCFHRPFPLF